MPLLGVFPRHATSSTAPDSGRSAPFIRRTAGDITIVIGESVARGKLGLSKTYAAFLLDDVAASASVTIRRADR